MLSATFDALRTRNERALVLFVTAGDPSLVELPAILDTIEEAGADIIEVGLPFSDPIADGPTIQAASQRALDRGVTPSGVLEAIHQRLGKAPVVLMGYYNTVLRRGPEVFATDARAAGVSGTIISDLTPEESDAWIHASQSAGLDTIFLAAPTSTEERLAEVGKRSSGFVYAVSRMGVTGAQSQVAVDLPELVARVRSHASIPICVGFGISSPQQVRTVADVADGVVVGSWLVDELAKSWDRGRGRGQLMKKVRALKAETRAVDGNQ